MGFGLSGRVEWALIDKDSGEITEEGYQDNIILDLGRKHFLGGWMGANAPAILVASGAATPDHTDETLDTLIAWIPNVPAGSAHDSTTYEAPTITYQATFQQPPEDYTVNKVGLGRYGQTTGSAPSGTSNMPYCVVKLSSPIDWPSTSTLQIRYRVTIEKYADD